MTAQIVVVTGTDTEVGKTFVAAALCHALRDAGLVVRALKPVESGVSGEPADHEDGVVLAHACDQPWPSAALQRFAAPLAPPVAAALEGSEVHDDRWAEAVATLAAEADVVLVEAAGGLLSPISPRHDARTLAQELGASLVVVGRDSLGTINHTRLVLEAARGIDIAGVVLSAPAQADESTGRNVAELRRVTGFHRVLTVERHQSPLEARNELSAAVSWFTVSDEPPDPSAIGDELRARHAALHGSADDEHAASDVIAERFELVEEGLAAGVILDRCAHVVTHLAMAIRHNPRHLHRYLLLRDRLRDSVLGPRGTFADLRVLALFDTAPAIDDTLDLRRTLAHLIETNHPVVDNLREPPAFHIFVHAAMYEELAVYGPAPADYLAIVRDELTQLVEEFDESPVLSPGDVCATKLTEAWQAYGNANMRDDFHAALRPFVQAFDRTLMTQAIDHIGSREDWFVREVFRDILWELMFGTAEEPVRERDGDGDRDA